MFKSILILNITAADWYICRVDQKWATTNVLSNFCRRNTSISNWLRCSWSQAWELQPRNSHLICTVQQNGGHITRLFQIKLTQNNIDFCLYSFYWSKQPFGINSDDEKSTLSRSPGIYIVNFKKIGNKCIYDEIVCCASNGFSCTAASFLVHPACWKTDTGSVFCDTCR